MRSRSLRYGAALCCGLRRRPLRQSAEQTRSSATTVTVTTPHRSKPLALRATKYDDVTVRRSVLSNSGGTALSQRLTAVTSVAAFLHLADRLAAALGAVQLPLAAIAVVSLGVVALAPDAERFAAVARPTIGALGAGAFVAAAALAAYVGSRRQSES